MSIHQGSFSLTRYRLVGGKKNYKFSELNQNLGRFQARPIRLKGIHKSTVFGWVRPLEQGEDGLLADEGWDMADCRAGDGFLLRVRIEKRKIPSQLLGIVFKKRLQQANKSKKDKVLGRKERQELLESVKSELLEQCLPAIGYIDAYWDEPRRELMVFSTARSALNLFEELFRKTFAEALELSLVRITPPLQGLSDDDWKGDEESKGRLEKMIQTIPSSFASQTI